MLLLGSRSACFQYDVREFVVIDNTDLARPTRQCACCQRKGIAWTFGEVLTVVAEHYT